MKITGLRIEHLTTTDSPPYRTEARQANMLDVYPEYAEMGAGRKPSTRGDRGKSNGHEKGKHTAPFVVIETDEGLEGWHGPIEYHAQQLIIMEGLASHLIGRDPLETRMLWDIMSRFERHASTGMMLCAISAVDIALWDLKGKILGQPVYKLLGGGRNVLTPYCSALGFSQEPDAVHTRAREIMDLGFTAQKWFFPYGPSSGVEGMKKNLAMAQAVRETVGEGYPVMFDCFMSWDYPYALEMLRELAPLHPKFVEEIFRPQMFDAYRRLSQESPVPLAAGEHFYSRMQVNQYLKDNVLHYLQSDPEWCGGLTEALRIADLCEIYGVQLLPHGHLILPAMHVVASMPPDVCPYAEYLLIASYHKTCFYQNQPLKDGRLYLNETPGIGEEINWDIVEKREVIHEFTF